MTRNSRKILGFTVMFAVLSTTGCSDTQQPEITTLDENSEVVVIEPDGLETERIIEITYAYYKQAVEEDKVTDLEMVRSIVNHLGENGYVAVDSKNQIDMTNPEQVMQFCEKVDTKKEAELIIIEVTYLGGFVEYNLRTKDGIVEVVKNYYKYNNGNMQNTLTRNYPVNQWQYTDEGYLMFSGNWFSEEMYVLTLSEAEEHTAFRVQPLDEKCRELNRQYLLPISYEQNNMFLVDWSEDDFGELNFYDLFDLLYEKVNAKFVPYVADDNLGIGAVYRIPKDELESIIMKYINIDSSTLQSKTTYYPEDETYEYKPRGFYEVEYPEYPYSEVVDFTENADGTIKLVVNVVYPYAGDSKVYSHEVVVHPLEDGQVQYVSNHIIPSEYNSEQTWHTPRLTEEEWEEIYGGSE